MKKLALLIVALIGIQLGSNAVEARRYYSDESGASQRTAATQQRSYRVKAVRKAKAYRGRAAWRSARSHRTSRAARLRRADGDTSFASFGSLTGGGGAGARPRQWCGWWMRTQLGGGPALNLAWNWSRYGSASSPQVGAVVVWRHHVGMITGRASNGQWIVKSGNDSNRVRERPRSVAGAVFRI